MSRLFLFLLVTTPLVVDSRARGGHGGGSHHGGGHSSHGGHYGGSHTYPSSGGYSGHGTGVHHTHQDHSYPAGTGYSGNNRVSGNTYHKTEIHHHYSPPQQIHYGSAPLPVYHAQPPVYVYQYRDSGSRFDTLLTGLALYNLGRMSSNHHYSSYHHDDYRYTSRPGEVCKFQINKPNGDMEETRIDCQLMSSFIWDEDLEQRRTKQSDVVSTNTVTSTTEVKSDNNTVVTTVTNSTVVSALDVKGPSIEVTPQMSCFMIRTARDSTHVKKKVDCGLLQTYAVKSFRNNSNKNRPILFTTIFVCSLLYISF